VTDYAAFARAVLAALPGYPISFEVTADDLPGMAAQARRIAGWGGNVFVKLPVTTSAGESVAPILPALAAEGVQCNLTALFTPAQVRAVSDALGDATPAFISVFAGRIADAGQDPLPVMREALAIMAPRPNQRLIWASPREVLNLVQADAIGCHVITMTPDLLAKLPGLGRDLDAFSLETVRMFLGDAQAAGLEP
jgi:transaldolase